jgi:hypothetical protein
MRRENRETGKGIVDLQQTHQAENRQMYNRLTQLQLVGQHEAREMGLNVKKLQLSSQEEIVACLTQHNSRFDQIQGSLGLVEYDLGVLRTQGDDTLLLVKQLVSLVDQRADGSAMISIRIPRALYDPSVSVWNGVSNRPEVITLLRTEN